MESGCSSQGTFGACEALPKIFYQKPLGSVCCSLSFGLPVPFGTRTCFCGVMLEKGNTFSYKDA